MTKKISAKKSEEFNAAVKALLEEIGARFYDRKRTDDNQYMLQTKYGNLLITVPRKQQYCWTVFSRFLDYEKAQKVPRVSCSGKWNWHISGGSVEDVLKIIREDLEKVRVHACAETVLQSIPADADMVCVAWSRANTPKTGSLVHASSQYLPAARRRDLNESLQKVIDEGID